MVYTKVESNTTISIVSNTATFTPNSNSITQGIIYHQFGVETALNIGWDILGSGVYARPYYYIGSALNVITNVAPIEYRFAPPAGWSALPTFQYDSLSSQVGSLSNTVPAGEYFAIMFETSVDAIAAAAVFSNLPDSNGVCFTSSASVLMADNTLKCIKDVERGDILIEDIQTGKTNTVAMTYKNLVACNGYLLEKDLIGNSADLVSTDHPIWCNNGENRILPVNIRGVRPVVINGWIYNIQYEDEGTFYANGVKVDSLPPDNAANKLPFEMYYDKSKYSDRLVTTEEDPTRGKPPMTLDAVNYRGSC